MQKLAEIKIKVVSNRKDCMALQLQNLQAFLPRPPGSYLQFRYFLLLVPQKVFLLSVVFLLLDSFSQYPTNGDIGYWEKLSKVLTAFFQLSVFCVSRRKNGGKLTKNSHFDKAWHFCRGPPDCRCAHPFIHQPIDNHRRRLCLTLEVCMH